MSNHLARVLILTLFSGENEFEACTESIHRQSHPFIDHIVFRNLPNELAHKLLYAKIMQGRAKYDLFIKLDADMVLTRKSCISEIVEIFSRSPQLDHLESKLFDVQSQSLISGLHTYSNRVRWTGLKSKLFVDPYPEIEGTRLIMDTDPAPFASHMENPSLKQCFIYGYHRALKISQKGVEARVPYRAKIQLDNLAQVASAHESKPSDKRIAILFGAEHGLKSTDAYLDHKSAFHANINISEFKLRKSGIQKRWRKRSPVFHYRVIRYVVLPDKIKRLRTVLSAQPQG